MKVWHGNCFINLCMQVRLGYFKNKDKYNIIIGSSNLTQDALSTNYEINIKLTANKDSKIVNETINNFNSIFFTG